MKKWNQMPYRMQNNDVKIYYDILKKKKFSFFLKRCFDIVFSLFLLVLLFPLFIIIFVVVKIDSKGPAIFMQTRITKYEKQFTIFKFRTMIIKSYNNDQNITYNNDPRITRVGLFLRKYKLDEIPQLVNILIGQMSFVGTRPEIPKYVDRYSKKMFATLLLPAGVTSFASIKYKNESSLIDDADDVDDVYINVILKSKMTYNLEYLEKFSFLGDIKIIFSTIFNVIKK